MLSTKGKILFLFQKVQHNILQEFLPFSKKKVTKASVDEKNNVCKKFTYFNAILKETATVDQKIIAYIAYRYAFFKLGFMCL